eukprot:TRINITY_DN1657_c2_g1_i1.p1 TRINITY_DN1657_c2_g1~~TRINITY_DN1657_c2_g1_i1.p1  ORF type:complete len:248 (+),score=56.45 TRINITY_DN1657_c2_g1_i1:9-752(+)
MMSVITDLLIKIGFIASEECTLNVLQTQCLTFMLSKFIGYLIIVGAIIVKVPQILKMLSTKSAQGVSGLMFLLEIVGYTISCSYGFVQGYPFSTYGENFPLALQNVVILFLIASFTKKSAFPVLAFSVVLAAFFASAVFGAVPLDLLQSLQTSTIFIFSASKIPQIWTNFKEHSAGQLSIVTFFMNFAGSMARVGTTFKEVDDVIVLAGYVVGALLNGIIVAQILIYGNATAPAPAPAPATKKTKKA